MFSRRAICCSDFFSFFIRAVRRLEGVRALALEGICPIDKLLVAREVFRGRTASERGLRLSAVREKVAGVEHSDVTQTTPKAWDLANVTITSMPAGAAIQIDEAFLGHARLKHHSR